MYSSLNLYMMQFTYFQVYVWFKISQQFDTLFSRVFVCLFICVLFCFGVFLGGGGTFSNRIKFLNWFFIFYNFIQAFSFIHLSYALRYWLTNNWYILQSQNIDLLFDYIFCILFSKFIYLYIILCTCLLWFIFFDLYIIIQWNICISNFEGLWPNFETSMTSRYPNLHFDSNSLTFPLDVHRTWFVS